MNLSKYIMMLCLLMLSKSKKCILFSEIFQSILCKRCCINYSAFRIIYLKNSTSIAVNRTALGCVNENESDYRTETQFLSLYIYHIRINKQTIVSLDTRMNVLSFLCNNVSISSSLTQNIYLCSRVFICLKFYF